MTTWEACKTCGEYREHYAKGKCKNCYYRERRVKNIIEYRKMRKLRIGGKRSTNTESPVYLGCDIAEKVLSKVFNNVEIMEPNNPGYDFICNKGKKIDVKSRCIRKDRWAFVINRNTIADFFLCIAFDNRESLTPLYLWLIPSSEVRGKKTVSIRPNTIHKWDKFKLDISKTLQCCNQMKD